MRFINLTSKFIVILALIVLMYYLGKSQTQLFSTILFALNIINIGVMAINYNKPSTMKWARTLTSCIKIMASSILMTEILFLAVIGEYSMSCKNQPNGEHIPGPRCDINSMDYWVFQKYPAFYSKLEFLGFRMQQDPAKNLSVEEW